MNDRSKLHEPDIQIPHERREGNGNSLPLHTGQIWFNKTRPYRTATILSDQVREHIPMKVQFKDAATGFTRTGELSLDRLLSEYTLRPLTLKFL